MTIKDFRRLVHSDSRGLVSLASLHGQKIAIDVSIALHESATTSAHSPPLRNFIFRILKLLESDVIPVMVFDGPPPVEKIETKKRQLEKIKEGGTDDDHLLFLLDGEEEKTRLLPSSIRKYGCESAYIRAAKKLCQHLGVPVVSAKGEADATVALLCRDGFVDASASDDYDTLVFGAPILLRGLMRFSQRSRTADASPRNGSKSGNIVGTWSASSSSCSGHRKNNAETVERIRLESVLESLGILQDQLVDISLLCGTDYNEGIPHIGPTKGLLLVKKHGFIENLPSNIDASSICERLTRLRSLFTSPDYEKPSEPFKLGPLPSAARQHLLLALHDILVLQLKVFKPSGFDAVVLRLESLASSRAQPSIEQFFLLTPKPKRRHIVASENARRSKDESNLASDEENSPSFSTLLPLMDRLKLRQGQNF